MSNYIVAQWVPYEGMLEVFEGDMPSLKHWFKQRNSNKHPLDDLSIYMVADIDPYEIAKEVNNNN